MKAKGCTDWPVATYQRNNMGFSNRRTALTLAIFLAASLGSACSDASRSVSKGVPVAQQDSGVVEVWKTPTCGCCGAWVEHLKENGFAVKVHDVSNTDSFRAALGMPQQYGSCHSARVAGYAIEGHVPAQDIRKLLAEKPVDTVGLAVPSMPMGSPGMEHPDHPAKRAEYDVLLINKAGGASSYTHYQAVH